MLRSRTYKLALLAGAATALQGCVAAVLPIAATGLMGGSQSIRSANKDAPPVTAAPAPEPNVTVELPPAQPALAVNTAAPVEEPGAATPTRLDPAPEAEAVAAAVPEPAPQPEPAPLIGRMAAPEPESVGNTEFADTFPVAEEDAPALSMVEPPSAPPPAPQSATLPAILPEPDAEPAPVSIPVGQERSSFASVPASQAPASAVAPRIIAVDPQTALSENSIDASSVSAAAAAAALASAAPVEDEPPPVSLARVPPTPAPAPAPAPARAPAPAPPPPSARTVAVAAATTPVAPTPARTSPVAAAAGPTAAPSSVADAARAVTALVSYSNQRQFQFSAGQERTSAMLVDRFSLKPDRAKCAGVAPTVLIDLDPEGGLFVPDDAARPPAGLSSALAQLRLQGVDVAWISGNPVSQETAIRRALNVSGLDLAADDQILLIRKADERKQTLREQLAQTACLVAIAGDTRSDFDEVYDYLLNPGEAASLDPLIGEGWFLIPQPLLSERPTP